nr:zinc finger, CCHC-type [Tanacetum cinerariifolium]
MGDENLIRTLGDYSRPSHEGYRNTMELLDGNNVVPLRSETIRLAQNGCSFYGLRSEDPNQHLKDFLKLVDLLDLDVANKEMTMERFEKPHLNREEINNRMVVMFRLLKELTSIMTSKKVLVREEARYPITKNYNAISLVKIKEEKNTKNNEVVDKNIIELSELNAKEPKEVVDMKKEVEDRTNDEPVRSVEEEITRDGIE